MKHLTASWQRLASTTYYHGTAAVLQPGDVLVPANQHGQATHWGEAYYSRPEQAWRGDRVWITDKVAGAFRWGGTSAGRKQVHVYEVEPLDTPVHDKERQPFGPGAEGGEYHVGSARVIREVPT
jgi:hypothetical protein